MDEKNGELLQDLEHGLQKNPRHTDLMGKLAKGDSHLNREEISLLDLELQIRNRAQNRAQVNAAMVLSEKTAKLAEKTTNHTAELVKKSAAVAKWTKWLAIATFALAVAAFLNLIIN